jgi:hypothetical protein
MVVTQERGREFWRIMAHDEVTLDIAVARQDILVAREELVAEWRSRMGHQCAAAGHLMK